VRSRRFQIALWAIVISVVVGLAGICFLFHHVFMEIGYNNYMPVGAAELIIEHMKANHGAWPKDWGELHKTFSSVSNDGVFRGFRWDAYSSRLGIDFAADPVKLAAAAKAGRRNDPAFRIIWLLPDRSCSAHLDPNTILYEYFKEQSRGSGGTKPD
jgi:hypothetical protein